MQRLYNVHYSQDSGFLFRHLMNELALFHIISHPFLVFWQRHLRCACLTTRYQSIVKRNTDSIQSRHWSTRSPHKEDQIIEHRHLLRSLDGMSFRFNVLMIESCIRVSDIPLIKIAFHRDAVLTMWSREGRILANFPLIGIEWHDFGGF